METLDRMLATMRSAFAALGRRAGQWVDRDGVGAIVMPSVPQRSLVNAVIYERGADVAAVYDELVPQFAGAWTVWVPAEDTGTARFLETRGHAHDADPAAMALELGRFEHERVECERATGRQLAEVNESAYPWHDGSLLSLASAISPDDFHLYALEDSCVLAIHDCDGDAGLFFAATRPEARGRGLATRLLGQALLDARERGCDISTLQATRMGEPVYARLGYRTFGRIGMWERK